MRYYPNYFDDFSMILKQDTNTVLRTDIYERMDNIIKSA